MGLHRWLMCFGQRLRGSRPRRKIGADTLKPRRALGKTWEQAPTAFEAAQLIKPPALRGVSDFVVSLIDVQSTASSAPCTTKPTKQRLPAVTPKQVSGERSAV